MKKDKERRDCWINDSLDLGEELGGTTREGDKLGHVGPGGSSCLTTSLLLRLQRLRNLKDNGHDREADKKPE